MNLVTQKIKLSKTNLGFAEDLAEALINSDETNYKAEDDIFIIRKFNVPEEKVDEKTADLKEGEILHWVSTPALDRDHEIMLPMGAYLKWYRKNPIVAWAHEYNKVENVLGNNVSIKKTEKGILAKTRFTFRNPQAEQVYNLYKDKVLKAWSVGFIPISGYKPDEEDGGATEYPPKAGEVLYIHEKWEMLEYSAVPIPSNPEVLTDQVAKSMDLDSDLFKYLKENAKELDDKKTKGKTIISLGGIDSKDGKKQKEEGKEEEKKEDKSKEEEKGKRAINLEKLMQEEKKGKAKYTCECVDCGTMKETDKHCKDLKCPKCGGQMRRVERPGPGKSEVHLEDMKNDDLSGSSPITMEDVSQFEIKTEEDVEEENAYLETLKELVDTQKTILEEQRKFIKSVLDSMKEKTDYKEEGQKENDETDNAEGEKIKKELEKPQSITVKVGGRGNIETDEKEMLEGLLKGGRIVLDLTGLEKMGKDVADKLDVRGIVRDIIDKRRGKIS